MDGARVAIALALLAVAPVAGCIQDLERVSVSPSWKAEAQLAEAPSFRLHGAPAMLSFSGTIQLDGDRSVTLTGFDANVSDGNRSLDMRAIRVHTAEGARQASNASGSLELEQGTELTVTFLPAGGEEQHIDPRDEWNASVDLLWRYRAGSEFDAGRIEFHETLAPEPAPGLGVGVVERTNGDVESIVFEAIEVHNVPSQATVVAREIAGGSWDVSDQRKANVTHAAGTATVTFDNPIPVPRGSGFLLLELDGTDQGLATTDLLPESDTVPSPGAVILLAAFGVAAALLGRRRP